MLSVKSEVKASPASAHSATTSAAVMTVMRTQPGTSPRSGRESRRPRRWGAAAVEARVATPPRSPSTVSRVVTTRARVRTSMVLLLRDGSGAEVEDCEGRVDREEDGDGEDEADDRNEHRHLLAAAHLHECSSPVLPDVGRLRAEDLREGSAA